MKARYMATQKDIKKVVSDEYKKYDTQAREETFIQSLAVFLTVLRQYRGHTPTYCKKIFDDINSKFQLMESGVFGKKTDVEDCVQYVKDEIGIDLEKEIKGNFSVKVKK